MYTAQSNPFGKLRLSHVLVTSYNYASNIFICSAFLIVILNILIVTIDFLTDYEINNIGRNNQHYTSFIHYSRITSTITYLKLTSYLNAVIYISMAVILLTLFILVLTQTKKDIYDMKIIKERSIIPNKILTLISCIFLLIIYENRNEYTFNIALLGSFITMLTILPNMLYIYCNTYTTHSP